MLLRYVRTSLMLLKCSMFSAILGVLVEELTSSPEVQKRTGANTSFIFAVDTVDVTLSASMLNCLTRNADVRRESLLHARTSCTLKLEVRTP